MPKISKDIHLVHIIIIDRTKSLKHQNVNIAHILRNQHKTGIVTRLF